MLRGRRSITSRATTRPGATIHGPQPRLDEAPHRDRPRRAGPATRARRAGARPAPRTRGRERGPTAGAAPASSTPGTASAAIGMASEVEENPDQRHRPRAQARSARWRASRRATMPSVASRRPRPVAPPAERARPRGRATESHPPRSATAQGSTTSTSRARHREQRSARRFRCRDAAPVASNASAPAARGAGGRQPRNADVSALTTSGKGQRRAPGHPSEPDQQEIHAAMRPTWKPGDGQQVHQAGLGERRRSADRPTATAQHQRVDQGRPRPESVAAAARAPFRSRSTSPGVAARSQGTTSVPRPPRSLVRDPAALDSSSARRPDPMAAGPGRSPATRRAARAAPRHGVTRTRR